MEKLTIDIDADKLFHDFEIEMQKRYGVSGCRLMELAEADKDGRCLILNKKFALTPKGKNPVWILRDNGIVKDFIVDAWLYFGRDGNLYCVYSTKNGIDIVETAVGNTVFFSQEAAEAAMKARRGDEDNELITALKRLKVETGSLACQGCGYEHNCGIHGCALIHAAIDRISGKVDGK